MTEKELSGKEKRARTSKLKQLDKQIQTAKKRLEKLNFQDNRDLLQSVIEQSETIDTESATFSELIDAIATLKETLTALKGKDNRYPRIIEEIFNSHYTEGASQIDFKREEIRKAAQTIHVGVPSNLGDVVYAFRYRNSMPDSVRKTSKKGHAWIIKGAGRGTYRFVQILESLAFIEPQMDLPQIKIPDSTPGVISNHTLTDEQALLAVLRYNRLVDIFTGTTCYSLQNHLRTTVDGLGQVETDEVYIGVDRQGAQYIFPLQAKGDNDALSIVQIEQDYLMCQAKDKFKSLVCRPIAAQFVKSSEPIDDSCKTDSKRTTDRIVLIELKLQDGEWVRGPEKHYRLVPPEKVTHDDLNEYAKESKELHNKMNE